MSLFFQCTNPSDGYVFGVIEATKPCGADVDTCCDSDVAAICDHVTVKWNEFLVLDKGADDSEIYDQYEGRNIEGFISWFSQGGWDVVCDIKELELEVI